MTQGQSEYTRFKQARFGPVFAQSLKISKAPSVARFPYYHVDLNAGGGFNHDAGVEGSPLNFLRAVERHGRFNVYAFFVDIDPEAYRQLIQQPLVLAFPSDRLSIHGGDNAEILPVVRQFIRQRERHPDKAVGSIVIDPNGYHGGVPWESLRVFCAEHPRIDLFVNLNLRTFRLEAWQIAAAAGRGKWGQKQIRPLSEFPAWFSRPSWMWTEPIQIKGDTWIQCVGRSMQTRACGYESLGFYDKDSERGRAICEQASRQPGADVPGGLSQLSLLPDLC